MNASTDDNGDAQLRVAVEFEFPYVRSLGPVVGAFAEALTNQRILGARTPDGRVLVPPVEWDPATGESIPVDLVEVGPLATVQSWTWVAEPASVHAPKTPFAFAQLRPDGADTTLVHVVNAVSPEAMSSGLRVRPVWKDERIGRIDDIRCWVAA